MMDKATPELLRALKRRLHIPVASRVARPPFRRKLVFETIEQRFLLSADLPVLPPPPQDPAATQIESLSTTTLPSGLDLPEPLAASSDLSQQAESPGLIDSILGASGSAATADTASLLTVVAAAEATADEVREIAFVDARVAQDLQITGVRDGMLVFLLDAGQDGIEQISKILAGFQGLDAVHLLSHGNAGQVTLGSTLMDADALAEYADALREWGHALRSGGDLMLYGCNVAEGERGIDFVKRLASATGADVAASIDATGSGALGGDWDLEWAVGGIQAASLSEFGTLNGDFLLRAVNGTGGADSLTFTATSPSTGNNFTWDDTVDGMAGSDTLSFAGFAGGVTFAIGSGGGVTATSGANSMTASAVEILVGGSGSDVLDLSALSTTLTFNFDNTGTVTVTGTGISLSASGIESIIGGSGVNNFVFDGNDSFAGSIDSNGSLNTLNYAAYDSGVSVDLAAGTAGAATGIAGTVTGITRVVGSAYADTFNDGGIGDTYEGMAGGDTYIFGDDWGTDTVIDTAGNDTLSFAPGANGIAVDFTDSFGTLVATEGSNRLDAASIETVEGSTGDDVFTAGLGETVNADVLGGTGNDRFVVETGSDFAGSVDGGADEDTIDYSAQFGNIDRSAGSPNFSGSLAGIEKVQHPLTVPNGLTSVVGLIQDGVDATVGAVEIPLLGNIGAEANSFISNIADGMVDRLSDALLVDFNDDRSTQEVIQDWLEDEFSFNFTAWVPGATLATIGLGEIDGDHMEFEFILEGVIFEDSWAIDFGGAIPGLGLSVDTELELSLTYELRFAFGVDYSDLTAPEFYFDTNGADDGDAGDDDEITITLSATLANGDIDSPDILATLGFLQFEVTSYDNSDQMTQDDPDTDSPYQDDNQSGLFGTFSIDLHDPGADAANAAWADDDGRLTQGEIGDTNFSLAENLSAKLSAYADVDLFARLSAEVVSAGLPSIQFYLHYDQTFAEAEIFFNGANQADFGGAPEVVIEDLSLNLGTFLSNFIQPILEQVQVVTGPLQPIVDVMKADIPILSDIDILKNLLNKDGQGGVDMLDFAGTILGGTKYASIVKAVNAIVELIDLVNSIPTEGDILINFGTFEFGGGGDDLRDSGSQMDMPDTSGYNSDDKIRNSAATAETKSFLEKLKRDPVGGGFSVPILTEPAEILKLITGRTANLFFYDLPELNFDFNFRKSTPIVFPLNMILDAGFDVTVRLGFGYDSSGIQEFIAGGATDPELIFKGFFIDDHGVEGTAGDLDEVEINSHFSVGASVGVAGIVEAGVEGGVIGNIGFDLNDVDSNGALPGGYDGKLYFHELDNLLSAGPECFLDIHGGLDWFLEAFVWVGLDLGFFGKITLYDETFDLGGGTIVEFDHHCDVVIPPNVAHLSGSDLILHMGSAADQRDDGASSGYGDLDGNVAESFTVVLSDDGTEYLVTYAGETKHFAASSVSRIVVADAQDGNDVLTVGEGIAADLEFHGGAGNDKVTYLGTGKALVYGDAGDDRITVASTAHGSGYDSQIYGGDGKDTLSGGAGNDFFSGGDGNDKIKGGAGDDVIYGGDESVAITGDKANGDIVDGGDGNDTIYGGTGADAIKGGKGSDIIYGGDESGVLSSGKALGDTIDGGKDNDTIYAGAGGDVVKGGDGDDVIHGGDGDDTIIAGNGIDQVWGDGKHSAADATARTGNDTIYWTVGEGLDSVIDGGTGNDGIVVTGADVNTTIALSNNGPNIDLAWGATTLTLAGVEKYNLNAGTGVDIFTINDVSANGVKEVSISLGGAVTEITQYDYNKDGTYNDTPPQMADGEGVLLFDSLGNPVYADVYADGTPVPYKVLKQFTSDASADSVTIYGGAGSDTFSAATAVTSDGSWVLNMSRQNPVGGATLTTYSVGQTGLANDQLTLYTLGGNDNVDFKDVGKDRDGVEPQLIPLTLDTGAGNDLLIGSQWNDILISGEGDDRVSGRRGVDTFSDASGNDQLFESRDADFTINRTTLTIGTETEATISPFEEVLLTGGASANIFNVSDWAGTLRMDGAGGSDTYNFWYRGTGDSVVTENDSGTTGNDSLNLYGTSGLDHFKLDANSADAGVLSDGKVQVEHGAIVSGSFVGDGSFETFNYTHSEFFTMHAGAGNDIMVVDDIASFSSVDIYGDQGDDTFTVGRVLAETLIGGVPVATSISNGTSTPARFYGDDGTDDYPIQPDAYYGDDYFEVNHNVAEVWLYGDAGDDTFVVNAHLTDSNPADDPAKNVYGGTGNNTISYVQNAAVNIDGGAGNDTVIVNGTGIGDTFIVTVVDELIDHDNNPLTADQWMLRQKVVGAGLQINMTDVERLEVNGAGGNDSIYVFGTLPGLDVVVRGGTGDDTILVSGAAVTVTIDPPPYNYTIPEQTIDPPAYIDHYDNYSFTWGDFWYWDWNFPFYHYVAPVTYSWSVPVWVDPAPYTIPATVTTIDPPPINFTAGPKYTLGSTGVAGGTGPSAFTPGIQGKLTIDGQLDNDTVIINNQNGAATDSGTLETYTDADGSHYRLAGLGMGTDGLTYTNTENVTIHMGAGDDQFAVDAIDPVTSVTLNLGNGNDHVDVTAMEGNLTINGGAGDDTVTAGSLAPVLTGGMMAGVAGALSFSGDAGSDTLNIDDTAVSSGSQAVLTGSTLSGLGMGLGVTSYTIDTLNIRLGDYDDLVEVQGTSAATHIWGNGGDDVFDVSSDGASLAGTLDNVLGLLDIDAGAGGNTLSVSDLGDTDANVAVLTDSALTGLAPAAINFAATGGRFTGGINVWAGRGSDTIQIDSTRLDDVTTLYANDGDDAVTVADLIGGADRLLAIHGDGGADTLDTSAVSGMNVTVLLFGDSGEEVYAGADKRFLTLTGASSLNPGLGGSDTLSSGTGKAILFGGAAGDFLYGNVSDDILIGDDGLVSFDNGVLTRFASLGSVGGSDTIVAGGGNNFVIGGAGDDTITALGGSDTALGDNGSVDYTPAGVINQAQSQDSGTGGDDSIDAGEGDNIIIGGFGADTLIAGAGNDKLIGDNGFIAYTAGIVAQFSSSDTSATTGGIDSIAAGDGDNLILGGLGGDTISAGVGNDLVIGDNGEANYDAAGVITAVTTTQISLGGNDSIDAGEGDNIILGGFGADTLIAGAGNDKLIGDNGFSAYTAGIVAQFCSSDTSATTGGIDSIAAGDGDNLILGGLGGDTISAGAGNDLVIGDNGEANYDAAGVITAVTTTQISLGGNDTIDAGEGDNIILGGFGGDALSAGDGDDVILGDNGNLAYVAGLLSQAQTIDVSAATGGDDVIDAGNGRNVVLGGVGNDSIVTGVGGDVVLGDNGFVEFDAAGNLSLARNEGSSVGGSDSIDTGAGNDVALGGGGADTLQGGTGNDILMGDGGFVNYAGGDLAMIEGDSGIGGADTLLGSTGNDVILGGFGSDTMDGNLAEDLLFGDNARILFSGGLVASIEILGQMDFVMQTLFDLYASGDDDEGGLPLPDVPEILASLPQQGDIGDYGELVTPQLALSPGGISLIFGRGEPLAAVPSALRNLLVDLILAHPDIGSGSSSDEVIRDETGEEGEGEGAEEIAAESGIDTLAVLSPTGSLPLAPEDVPSENNDGGAASLAFAALAGVPGLRTRVFDPIGGRWQEASAGTQAGRAQLVSTLASERGPGQAAVPLDWLVSDEDSGCTEIRSGSMSRIDWNRSAA